VRPSAEGAPRGDAAAQVGGVARALVGHLGEEVDDEPVEVVGQLGAEHARRAGHGVPVADEDGPGVVEVERRRAGGEFVQDAAERVEVAAVVDVAAADLLRGHVVGGAHGDAGAGEA